MIKQPTSKKEPYKRNYCPYEQSYKNVLLIGLR